VALSPWEQPEANATASSAEPRWPASGPLATWPPPGVGIQGSPMSMGPSARQWSPASECSPTRDDPWAIASLVMGIATVPTFISFIPGAIAGLISLRRIRRSPSLAGRGLAIAGIIISLTVASVEAAIAVPTFLAEKSTQAGSANQPAPTAIPPVPSTVDPSSLTDPLIAPPTHLTATVIKGGSQVRLNWSQPTSDYSWSVFRAAGRSSFDKAAWEPTAGSPGQAFDNPPPGHVYTYFVVAGGTPGGVGPYSRPARVVVAVP
jgi:hypothetical protein